MNPAQSKHCDEFQREESRDDAIRDYTERERDNVHAKILRTPDDLIFCMQNVWAAANEPAQFEICKSLLWKPTRAASFLNRPSDVASRLAALLEDEIIIETDRQLQIDAVNAYESGVQE